jgi:hypothetical protein
MKKAIYLIVLLVPAIFIHCSKDEPSAPVTRLELLTGHKWKIDKLLYSVKGDPVVVTYTNAVYKTCELDDEYSFRKDGSFLRTDGTNLCGSVALYGPYGTSNWSADSSLTNLSVGLTFYYDYKYKVVNLTATELRLEMSTVDYLQQQVLYTYYFKAGN